MIGQYELARITPSVVRDWYANVTLTAGRDQAAKSYRLLRAILNTAVDDELIVRNPCRIRGGGSERADERPMIEAALVFKLADSISARLRALVLLAGFVGLRTGESLGLRRCDDRVRCGFEAKRRRRFRFGLARSRRTKELENRRPAPLGAEARGQGVQEVRTGDEGVGA